MLSCLKNDSSVKSDSVIAVQKLGPVRRDSSYQSIYDIGSILTLPDQRRWALTPHRLMSEQKWVVLYGIAVILLQNPVYSFICWDSVQLSDSDTSAIFAFYVVDSFAQALLFSVW